MGMTLVGQNPSNNLGRVIHFSMWVWHPMVEYLEKNHYDVIQDFPSLRHNVGEVPSDMATKLGQEIQISKVISWTDELSKRLMMLPMGPCFGCFGFGRKRNGIMHSTEERCEVCFGSGKSRQYVTQYYFKPGHMAHLKDFLLACGGFKLS